jgi:hypothetical protein
VSLVKSFYFLLMLILQGNLSSKCFFDRQYHPFSTSFKTENCPPIILRISYRLTIYEFQIRYICHSWILQRKRYPRFRFIFLYLPFHCSSSDLHICHRESKSWCLYPTSFGFQLATLQCKCSGLPKQLFLSTPASRTTRTCLGHISRRPDWFVSPKLN